MKHITEFNVIILVYIVCILLVNATLCLNLIGESNQCTTLMDMYLNFLFDENYDWAFNI